MFLRLKPIDEQTIVITGGSSGNGLATAQGAVDRGARVVLAARNRDALEQVAADLRRRDGQVAICAADVSREEDVEQIGRVAIERFGGFDSWVNDAAAATYGRMDQVTLEDHRRVFDVNYHGLLMGSLVAARHLRQRGGAIINVGSVLSDRAMIYQGPYSATKAAVQAATDALRMELERDRAPVSVTLIKPGSVNTPYPEHARNYMAEPPRLPPFLYDPALVADAILFACENPRRHLYIGGSGYLISLGGRLAPRLMDIAMEVFGGSAQHKPGDPGEARQSLPSTCRRHGPRRAGRICPPHQPAASSTEAAIAAALCRCRCRVRTSRSARRRSAAGLTSWSGAKSEDAAHQEERLRAWSWIPIGGRPSPMNP